MMKIENSLIKLKEVIKSHEPLIVNYGKGKYTEADVKEIAYWNSNKNRYDSETGQWSIELLLEIAKGDVPGYSIELMQDE